jgi:hypothetical protein
MIPLAWAAAQQEEFEVLIEDMVEKVGYLLSCGVFLRHHA